MQLTMLRIAADHPKTLDGPGWRVEQAMSGDDIFDRLPVPADLVIAQMEAILAEDHGKPGVRVSIDGKRGQVVCDPEIPVDLSGRVFAEACKRAIIKHVRDQEGRGDA